MAVDSHTWWMFDRSDLDFILPSPDGARLLYQSSVNDLPALYMMNADGANPTRLSPDEFVRSDWPPAWSPDGSRILFSCLGRREVRAVSGEPERWQGHSYYACHLPLQPPRLVAGWHR